MPDDEIYREQLPTGSQEQPNFNAQEFRMAALAEEEGTTVGKASQYETPPAEEKPRGSWAEAWRELRTSPRFYVSAVIMLLLIVMAIFPSLFTSVDPKFCPITRSSQDPSSGHWFGTNTQGCDVYARTIYGARASITVGVLTTILVIIVGGFVGAVSGYFGGWVDSVLARITDMFFGIPLLLGALVFLSAFTNRNVWLVVAALGFLGWMQIARIMRGSVITVKEADYVVAARALGAGTRRVITRHILPNSIAPVIVVATISLGIFIASEATLSFLGIGLPPSTVSWGNDISSATTVIRDHPSQVFFPSLFLSLTVFSFILLGDAVRDALDPKLR